MPGNDLPISRLAVRGAPTYDALVALDAAGDHNGRMSAEELARLTPSPGVTLESINAVQASFVNSIAPERLAGVRFGGTPLPVRGRVTESLGTAAKTVVLAGGLFPDISVSDQNGAEVGAMTRRLDSRGVGDFFQNIFGTTLTLKDTRGAVIAEAHPRLIDTHNLGNNFRTLVDINDAQGNRIGTIRQTWESVGGSFLQNMALGRSIWTSYEILDPNGEPVARSAKTEFFATSLDVNGAGGEAGATGHQATMQRRYWQSFFHDIWNYDTDPNAQVDRRVLTFMAAYKTMADIQKRQKGWAEFWSSVVSSNGK